MIFDTHAHLDDEAFEEDLYDLLELLPKRGVGHVLIPAVSSRDWDHLLELGDHYDFLFIALGIHPSEVRELKDVHRLEEYLSDPRVVAVGEIGLDYHWTTNDYPEQHELLKAQLELAKKYKKPVLIHDREAHEDVRRLIDEVDNYETGVVLHSFSGSPEWAMEYIKRGAYISLSGPITFKNAKTPKEVAKVVPLDRLLVETDSPYLTPHPYRGKRNDPTKVRYIIEEIARVKELSTKEVEEATFNNAKRLFCKE